MKFIRKIMLVTIVLLACLMVRPAIALAATGFVVCLDPGHGTYYYDASGAKVIDGGASGNGVTEAPTNMAIALACKAELEASGYTVILTHEDTYYYQGEKGSYYNEYTGITLSDTSPGYNWANWKSAVDTAVSAQADLFVEIHCNSAGNITANGAEAYCQYATSGTKTSSYNLETCAEVSNRTATSILSCLSSEVGLYNRGTKVTTRANVKYPDGSYTDGYSWLILAREQNLPAVLVEHGFVTNANDAAILKGQADAIGKADAHAIMEALEHDGAWTTNATGRAFKKPDGTLARNEWVSILGFSYYFNANGNPATGNLTLDGMVYSFTSKGKLYAASAAPQLPDTKVGWRLEDGAYYYYDANGNRVTNSWQKFMGTYYYLGSDGALVADAWVAYGGKYYYFDENGLLAANRWVEYGGKYYYLGKDAAMVTNSWALLNGTYYYLGSDGALVADGWVVYGGKCYYFGEDGLLVTNRWLENGGKHYYLGEDGALVTGWQNIDGVWRYFNADATLAVDSIVRTAGVIVYFGASGTLEAGWHEVEGLWYHIDETTYVADTNTWIQANGSWYCIGAQGAVVTNEWATDGDKWYYMGADGRSVSGWVQYGGNWYYLDPTTHAAVNGTVVIDGKSYTFVDYVLEGSGSGSGSGGEDYKSQYTEVYAPTSVGYVWHLSSNGLYYYEVDSAGQTTGAWQWVEPIMGTSKTTVDAMVNAFKKRGVSYPSSVYSSKGASTIREFCQILYEECQVEGVRAEVMFAQVMWETGWLQFGGSVKPAQCNFGGIGATGGGAQGNSFSSVREGLRAQVQHLKAYGSTSALVNACVDPRFGYVTRGIIPYVQGLGVPDDPVGYGWAGGRLYGAQLVNLMRVYLGV